MNTKVHCYYASDGIHVFTNSTKLKRNSSKPIPAYMLFEEYKREFYPKETVENQQLHWITEQIDEVDLENTVVFIAFPERLFKSKNGRVASRKSKPQQAYIKY